MADRVTNASATGGGLSIAEHGCPARRLLGTRPSPGSSFGRVGHIGAFRGVKRGLRQALVASEGDFEAHPRISWRRGEDLEVVPAPLDAPARHPQVGTVRWRPEREGRQPSSQGRSPVCGALDGAATPNSYPDSIVCDPCQGPRVLRSPVSMGDDARPERERIPTHGTEPGELEP